MSDHAAYSLGHAVGLRAASLPCPQVRAMLASLIRDTEARRETWVRNPALFERRMGMLDGLADILRRRQAPGLVEVDRG